MRYAVLLPILCLSLLAGCQVPGRNVFASSPVGADTQSVSALQAFKGRVPLVSILPGTTDFAGPVKKAVREALAIKPSAEFEVRALSPAQATPDASAKSLADLSATASAVAQAVVADGVPASRVLLTARSAGLDAAILIYVK